MPRIHVQIFVFGDSGIIYGFGGDLDMKTGCRRGLGANSAGSYGQKIHFGESGIIWSGF